LEVRFLVDIDPAQRTGLFNAVTARVACVPQSVNYNLSYFDSVTIRFLKRLLGFTAKKKKEGFESGGVFFTPLHVQADALYYLAKIIGPLIPFVFRRDSKSILEMIGAGQYILSAHWGVTSGLLAHFISRQTKMKYVVTYHGSDIHTLPQRSFWLRRLLLRSLRDSEINIFVSKALLAEARSLGYEKSNSIVLYNGVDKEKFSGGSGGLPDICNEIVMKEPSVKFLFAGEGKYLGRIESSIPKENVVILGMVEPEYIVDVMSLLDVLIVPSRNEGLPLVLLEAMASGVNVIASNVGGIPELLSEDYLVDLGDDFVGRFSQKVVSTLKDGGQNILDDRFDWEYIRAQELQVYQAIR
jgi:glycosyltransferase involved in cell wall biosynthesis